MVILDSYVKLPEGIASVPLLGKARVARVCMNGCVFQIEEHPKCEKCRHGMPRSSSLPFVASHGNLRPQHAGVCLKIGYPSADHHFDFDSISP